MIETTTEIGAGKSRNENNPRYPAAIAHAERPTGMSILMPKSSPMFSAGFCNGGGP